MKAATIAFATAPVRAGPAKGQSAPNDAPIAYVVVTVNQLDIDAGESTETNEWSVDVPALGAQMVTDRKSNNKEPADLAKRLAIKLRNISTSQALKPGGEANINLPKLAATMALALCAGIAHAEQVQGVIRASAYTPDRMVMTRAELRQFGRDSVFATQSTNPGKPILAGGQTVDEAGGAPLYATQLTHPSGPIMVVGDDLQPYGRDTVYAAGPPNAAPRSTRDHQAIVRSQ